MKEKVAQLFLMRMDGAISQELWRERLALLNDYQVGGVFWSRTDKESIKRQTAVWQRNYKVGLLSGSSTKLRALPQMASLTLGAIQDDELLKKWGETVGNAGKKMGLNYLALPSLSIAVNLHNPIWKDETMGAVPNNVARVSTAYARGVAQAGAISIAGGFPGEGDLLANEFMRVLDHGRARLDSVELYPYKYLIEEGISLVGLGNLAVQDIDQENPIPVSLSSSISQQLLREELQFKGVIISQPLTAMQQYSSSLRDTANIYIRSLRAGVDMLFDPPSLRGGISAILTAVAKGQLSEELINERVEHILHAKYKAGIHQPQPPMAGTSSIQQEVLRQKLYEKAVTVIKNPKAFLPFKEMPEAVTVIDLHITAASYKEKERNLGGYINRYVTAQQLDLSLDQATTAAYQAILKKAQKSDYVIIGLHGLNQEVSQQFGITPEAIQFLKALSIQKEVVVVAMGAPYVLSLLEFCPNMVCAYESTPLMADVVSQSLFGAVSIEGKLPVQLSYTIPAGVGLQLPSLKRLGYALPEAVGVNGALLTRRVDSLVQLAISNDATPGGQVLFAKDGKIIFEKAYGYYDYDKETAVDTESVYDLASLTKVLSTLQATMKLEGEGNFEIDGRVGDYIAEAQGTNKANLKWKDILTHQSGLQPFLAHYPKVLKYHPELLSDKRSNDHSIPVAKGIYGHYSLPDSLFEWTMESSMRYRRYSYRPYTYRYSDVGFYMLMWMIEAQTQQPLDKYVTNNFYKPLGLKTLGYHPLRRMPEENIVPTEFDRHFRNQILQGHVDDPGASLLGGVGGHAGLFAHARDVAIIMQMNLQDGYYGGKQYIAPGTIQQFNVQPFAQSNDNRRALGWDKPTLKGYRGSTSPYAPHALFGHTGFTGTCTWADPVHNTVYVFLANRINPYAGNKKFIREDYRELTMEAMYKAMGIEEKRPER